MPTGVTPLTHIRKCCKSQHSQNYSNQRDIIVIYDVQLKITKMQFTVKAFNYNLPPEQKEVITNTLSQTISISNKIWLCQVQYLSWYFGTMNGSETCRIIYIVLKSLKRHIFGTSNNDNTSYLGSLYFQVGMQLCDINRQYLQVYNDVLVHWVIHIFKQIFIIFLVSDNLRFVLM